ncbi:PHP domain-containing protein [Paenibacillus agricola]|uniref:Histidinol-phosphatase n=1 Tax=Paenibacillus agricola TaxID=2716264 RepID=A0ABX0JIJ7_9BACL|nr:PHP domain-containing protein [Paenibacillus agricola]NHN35194.1 histidinol phosphate phosphatase domain-containing protein [Paenibacillus agricola]
MRVDHHFHLEEGPYSTGWLQRTARALAHVNGLHVQCGSDQPLPNSLQWIQGLTLLLNKRLEQGCFSPEWIQHYFCEGAKQGIGHYGLVDHLYRFHEFRAYYEKYMILDGSPIGRIQQEWLERVCVSSIEPFLSVVHQMKQEAGVSLSLGVEVDYFPGGEDELRELLSHYEFDYVIGSIHFLDGWGFDNPETQGLFKEKDLVALYNQLFNTVKSAAASGIFDIIAHLDNLKVFGYRPDESLLLPMYEEVAHALKQANVATELNTGLAYRYPVKEACPSPTFLQVLGRAGVPITTSSDAHYPDDIGTLLDEAEQLLDQAGYKEIVYFQNRSRIFTPLKLGTGGFTNG